MRVCVCVCVHACNKSLNRRMTNELSFKKEVIRSKTSS